ncbi:unnamed protein product [Fusarium graminearum]|uniref:Uncharacterized protein n=1 Tax=Gibberella zeae TaxID=5518 RepID=A0A9N8WY64_GIBZA|nr:unnamed protein product [Fusarium graminearum]
MDTSNDETKKDGMEEPVDIQPITKEETDDSSHRQSVDMSQVVRRATDEERKNFGLEPFSPQK